MSATARRAVAGWCRVAGSRLTTGSRLTAGSIPLLIGSYPPFWLGDNQADNPQSGSHECGTKFDKDGNSGCFECHNGGLPCFVRV